MDAVYQFVGQRNEILRPREQGSLLGTENLRCLPRYLCGAAYSCQPLLKWSNYLLRHFQCNLGCCAERFKIIGQSFGTYQPSANEIPDRQNAHEPRSRASMLLRGARRLSAPSAISRRAF